jgi:hypothetical protein
VAVLKIAPFWKSPKRNGAATVMPLDDSLGLDAFGSEEGPAATNLTRARKPRVPSLAFDGLRALRASRTWLIAGSVALLAAMGIGAYALRNHQFAWGPKTGSITFDTIPSGIEVFVGHKSVGHTPTTAALAPGVYDVLLGSGPHARPLKVTVTAGSSVVQHYEMAVSPPAAPPPAAGIRIQTDPANLPVLFDGVEKGRAPVTIATVDPGDHEVAVRRDQTVIKQAVHVVAGQETSVIISSAPPAPTKPQDGAVNPGWLTAVAPIPLKVKEGGRIIGSSDVDRLMLPSGDHDLEFGDDALGFRVTRHVNISAGKTTVSSIQVPNGSMSVNAFPWADIYIDGNYFGQTPLGNLTLRIGTHEVVFRHPDLGERKETVTVTTLAPTRLGVDLTKK